MSAIYILISAYIITAVFATWAIFNNRRLVKWEDKFFANFKKSVRTKFSKNRASRGKTFMKALKPSAASSARVRSSGYVA